MSETARTVLSLTMFLAVLAMSVGIWVLVIVLLPHLRDAHEFVTMGKTWFRLAEADRAAAARDRAVTHEAQAGLIRSAAAAAERQVREEG